jgi:1-acyl-sn-glycerol-3-phosphate acyltransferase
MNKFIILLIIKVFFFIYIQFHYIYTILYDFFNESSSTLSLANKKSHEMFLNIYSMSYNIINNKLNITGNYKITNKIDIIISNHLFIFDTHILISLLTQIDNREVYFIAGYNPLIYLGGFPLLMSKFKCIFINKDSKKDEKILKDKLNNINHGIIVIFPEGAIINKHRYEKSIDYCKKNNLKPFNNLLYPRTTCLLFIINELKKKNKLGNLIDLTIVLSKNNGKCNMISDLINSNSFKNKNIYDVKDIHIIIHSYKLNKQIENRDVFKKFLLNIYKKKDIILNGENYKNYDYKLIKYNKIKKIKVLLLVFIVIYINIHLIKHTHGIILLIYIFLILYKNIKLVNDFKTQI